VGAAGAGLGGYLLGAGVDVADSQSQVATALRPAQPAAPPPPGADFAAQGTPTFLTSNRDFYRIDTALRLPAKAATDWSMKVHGMVERELTISYQDLLNRPLIERPVTLTCVSNEVGGNLISTANFVGVSLRDLLLEAGVRPGADQLFSTSLDGFTAGTPVEVVLEPNRGAMLALGMNSAPLPLEHGYPVRMVIPGLYGFVSATKWLADLELTTFDAKQSYWLQRGWAQQAPIKTQSRIDRPQQGSSVPAGPFTAAGIAWAQHRGIASVEVRLDGGAWQQAQLSTEVSSDTWRMWRIDLTVPPGDHTLECRATDLTGQTQTDARANPVPDGATGWPSVALTAR
jgi:DMSO/TMAO reductase YedYZ molybdopterin-dependent catalytic subunit